MFGRLTRVVALAAIVTHLWVTMVVAPWHHLVEHRLVATNTDTDAETRLAQPVSGCRCHAHRTKAVPACSEPVTAAADSSDGQSPPASPHRHDDCQVCQVLTQQFTTLELPRPVVAQERIQLSPPVSAVQPMLGALIDPVSRGPPAV